MKKLLLLVASLAFVFSSCSSDNYEDVNPSSPSGIFGIRGDLNLADYEKIASNVSPYQAGTTYPDFGSVVFIKVTEKSDEFIGSGVLIAPNWVLTASHNFYFPGEDKTPKTASQVKVSIGNDPNNPQATYSVEQIILHPTWSDGDGGFERGNDICLVKLTKNVAEVSPATINFTAASPKLNDKIWFAGFGDYSSTAGQNANLYSKKHALENILDRKVDGLTSKKNNTSYEGGLLAFDFDSPDGSFNTLGDAIINLQEKALGNGTSSATALAFEGTTVQGDSGGPLFAFTDNKWVLIGILHGGIDDVAPNVKDAAYGDISVFTQTASHVSWIKSIVK